MLFAYKNNEEQQVFFLCIIVHEIYGMYHSWEEFLRFIYIFIYIYFTYKWRVILCAF